MKKKKTKTFSGLSESLTRFTIKRKEKEKKERRAFGISKVEERAEKIPEASGETKELSGTPEEDEGDGRGSRKNKKEARKNERSPKNVASVQSRSGSFSGSSRC